MKNKITEQLEQNKYLILSIVNRYQVNGYDKEDLIQEANLEAINAIKKYDNTKGAKLSTYIYICVNSKMIKLLKKAQREKNQVRFNEEYDIVDQSQNSVDRLVLAEQVEQMYAAIATSLSQFEKDVILQRLQEKTIDETAKILNKDPKKIDNALQRAKKKLRSKTVPPPSKSKL